MSKLTRSVALLLCSLASLPCAAQEALTGAALREWYAGISLDGNTERGATFRAFHAPDGKISAVVDGRYRNTGTWKIVEPGQVCVRWADASWGSNPCFAVFKDGELWKIVRVDDAGSFSRVKRVEGNPFGL